jgi:hypothetical protein
MGLKQAGGQGRVARRSARWRVDAVKRQAIVPGFWKIRSRGELPQYSISSRVASYTHPIRTAYVGCLCLRSCSIIAGWPLLLLCTLEDACVPVGSGHNLPSCGTAAVYAVRVPDATFHCLRRTPKRTRHVTAAGLPSRVHA